MADFKKFTKAQFNAMTNEIVRLARKFTENNFSSSLTFTKDSLTLYVHDDRCCVCLFTLHKERYINCKEFKELVDVAIRANVTLDGHYVTMMKDAFDNDKRGHISYAEYIDY